MSLDPAVILRARVGTTVAVPQVLLNYAPASRGPWRLKALLDEQGHPVTSRFIAVRPKEASYSIKALWSFLNSPIANAFAFSHLGKRDNIVGDIRRIPVPKKDSFRGVELAATAYLEAAWSRVDAPTLQKLLLQVDCEVLRLYSLPCELEQSLLALFNDRDRVGVPFTQRRYLPAELSGAVRLSDFLQFEGDWSAANRERGKLIDNDIAGTLDAEGRTRLDALQAYADYHLDQITPRPTKMLDELEDSLLFSIPKKDTTVR